jgi:argininosuccinate lyase
MSNPSAWGGRFSKGTAPLAQRFGASVPFDWRLYRYDVAGSIAHSRMLAKQGIIEQDFQADIERGLRRVLAEIEAGTFEWQLEREDVHLNLEAALGEAGRSLHTARSRNDQVALDTRMFVRESILASCQAILQLQQTLVDLAGRHADTLLPGYTHLQRAQPVSLGHHLLAYVEMLRRDFDRLVGGFVRVNVLPLGAGALAGVPYPIDPEYTARLLGFDAIAANSIDAVSDRDFLIEFLAGAALCGVHLSRLAEELVLWSTAEFRYVELDDAWTAGSSIMPQKKNPDFAELVRGKTGRLTGDLVALLTVLKGLPLAYNKDLQEDKEPLFDASDTLLACLEVTREMLATATFNTDRMALAAAQDYSTATDLADYLVGKGMAFRDAHRLTGQLVAGCISRGQQLDQLTLDQLRHHSELFEADALQVLSVQASAAARDVPGGTAPSRVRHALTMARHQLSASETRLEPLKTACSKVHSLLSS